MLSRITLIMFCLVIIQCSENQSIYTNQTPPPKSSDSTPDDTPDSPINVKKPGKACYVIDETNTQSCLELVDFKDLSSPNDYHYLDPVTHGSFPKHFDFNQYQQPIRFVDLNRSTFDTRISKNFLLGEFMQIFKGQYGLLSKTALIQIQEMRNVLNAAINVNSGFRGPAYNGGLAGAANWSRHMYGDALDFYVKNVSFEILADLCLEKGASFYQIYQSHIHCDWRNLPLDEDYYPGPVSSPQFRQVKLTAEKQSQIEFYKRKSAYYFTVSSDYIEDSISELTYQWTATDSTGRSQSSKKAKFKLSPSKKGRYKIDLVLGGSIELSRSVDLY